MTCGTKAQRNEPKALLRSKDYLIFVGAHTVTTAERSEYCKTSKPGKLFPVKKSRLDNLSEVDLLVTLLLQYNLNKWNLARRLFPCYYFYLYVLSPLIIEIL